MAGPPAGLRTPFPQSHTLLPTVHYGIISVYRALKQRPRSGQVATRLDIPVTPTCSPGKITALGRRTYVRDGHLQVKDGSARFYGTLHMGVTENSCSVRLMTVEENGGNIGECALDVTYPNKVTPAAICAVCDGECLVCPS